jgi:hypothetical protein
MHGSYRLTCAQPYCCTNLRNVADRSNLLLPSSGNKGNTPNTGVAIISTTFVRTLENVLMNAVVPNCVKLLPKVGQLQLQNESSRFLQNVGIKLPNHAASDPTTKLQDY